MTAATIKYPVLYLKRPLHCMLLYSGSGGRQNLESMCKRDGTLLCMIHSVLSDRSWVTRSGYYINDSECCISDSIGPLT